MPVTFCHKRFVLNWRIAIWSRARPRAHFHPVYPGLPLECFSQWKEHEKWIHTDLNLQEAICFKPFFLISRFASRFFYIFFLILILTSSRYLRNVSTCAFGSAKNPRISFGEICARDSRHGCAGRVQRVCEEKQEEEEEVAGAGSARPAASYLYASPHVSLLI